MGRSPRGVPLTVGDQRWSRATVKPHAASAVTGEGQAQKRGVMRALVFHGSGKSAWQDVADPAIQNATDAIVRVDAVTICGTDLHILKGDVPEVRPGTVLGHEAVGEIVLHRLQREGMGHQGRRGQMRPMTSSRGPRTPAP